MIAHDGVAFWDLPKSILSIRQQTKVFLKIIRHSNKKGGKIQTHKLPMGVTQYQKIFRTGDYKNLCK
jgi:hypothetical protein